VFQSARWAVADPNCGLHIFGATSPLFGSLAAIYRIPIHPCYDAVPDGWEPPCLHPAKQISKSSQ